MSYQKQRDPRDRFPNSMEPSNGRRDDRGKGHRGSEPEYKYLVRADDLPPSHDHYHEDGPEPNTKPKVTDLEKASKSNRTFLKHAPTKETIDERGVSVVMCRYNPTHILDVVNIDHHEEVCRDRALLEQYGCRY
ncbi:hypothetical protein Q1695_013466 [Nippostrongylus brasiliensis]|nr:hypothetical protein Q1695_013466 [Nippostrongylus brasiliensis]